MRFILLAILCLAAAGTASAQTAPHRNVPRIVMNVALRDSVVFKVAGAGIAYRYGPEQPRHDVYVYPKTGDSEPVGQAAAYIEYLPIEKQKGYFDSYEVVATDGFNVQVGDDAFIGHEVLITINRHGESLDSYFAVVALSDVFVKFRITRPRGSSELFREFVLEWVREYHAHGP